ncbi:hypothetical protein EBS02_12035 [bacterium]|nr:hypothetical protein [bacterium]
MHHNCTFHGLHQWCDHLFEKLGYMVLAHRNKHISTIKCYLKSLKTLQQEIKSKHAETVDIDRKKDLEEMLSNILYLEEQSKKMFL